MKKYLMMGIAILALASCTKHDIEYVNPDVVKYEQVFTERFGTPSPTHTWGFGSSITRSAYPNANQWASQGYNVPDPLSAGQKARVQFYFQTKQFVNPVNKDFNQIDFFMQQVYDGCTDPITKYSDLGYTSPTYSAEEYAAANNQTMIQSGEHMDHLTAGSDHEHVYNFNNGTCSTNSNVGDNGAALDTKQHSDEIMLMLNTKTDVFGYANSDASFVRDDRYVLVSGADIDAYITQNKAAYDAWLAKHAGVEDAIVDDDWHRSFIGFDFDMIPDDKLYVKENDEYKYFSMNLQGKTQVWNGTELVDATTVGEVVTIEESWGSYQVFYPYIPGTTTKIRMISDQTNQYCGSTTTITDAELEYEVNNVGKFANLVKVYDLIDDYALPTSSGAGKTWIKIGNCADHYYSDWIVSFMPATSVEQEEYDYRVMAEDLSTSENSDFDFNDVVFDVKYVSSTTAKVKVRAAGGIYPIRIDGKDNYEIHALLGGGMTMTNTYPGRHNEYDAETFEVSGSFGSSAADPAFKAGVGAIKIEVNKGNGYTELTAPTGKVASKIGVPVDVDWCDEYQDIDEKWGTGAFAAWVADESNPFWTNKTQWNQ